MNDNKEHVDAYDEIFASPENTAGETTPEPVSLNTGKTKPTKKKGLLTYVIYGIAGVVGIMLVLIIIIVALPSPKKSSAPTITIATQDIQTEDVKETDAIAESKDKSAPTSTDNVYEVVELKELLEEAMKNTDIRDKKYQELLSQYKILLQENASLKEQAANFQKENKQFKRTDTHNLKSMNGVSINSIYSGYAFIKVNNTIYSITVGEKINGAIVKEINPVNREIITTAGVIR